MILNKPPVGIKTNDTSQIVIFGGAYLKMREYLYPRFIIEVNTVLNLIDTKAILPRDEGFCMVCRLEWHQNKIILKCPFRIGIKI